MQKKTLVVTDNPRGLALAHELDRLHGGIDIRQSPNGPLPEIPRLDVRTGAAAVVAAYDLVLSIHCKQIFPPELVGGVRCVNVHPGLNPHNRGWFPHVFSILNGLPGGVTIHEMDEQLDHGPIIVQRECRIESWDTSGSAYERIMALERELLLEWFVAIRAGAYVAVPPAAAGNVNSKGDFDRVRRIDRAERGTFGGFLDRLRALTHGDHRNAFFIDAAGRKVFVRISLEPDDS
jgi:methionyl-tRNA formyltransferase